ncbi:MAG: hypothetical protein HZC49_09440 [Nitrospirae bacterium]|nr:hypothetical protein [Nitrospirota bacterium]
MSLKYKIIKSIKTVYVIGQGVISFTELMDHINKLAQDQDYNAPMKKLVDYRTIKSLDLSMSESEAFAQEKAKHNDIFSGERCAIVTPLDSNFGMARVHDALIGLKDPEINTMVFRDFNKAQEWLGINFDDDDLIIS